MHRFSHVGKMWIVSDFPEIAVRVCKVARVTLKFRPRAAYLYNASSARRDFGQKSVNLPSGPHIVGKSESRKSTWRGISGVRQARVGGKVCARIQGQVSSPQFKKGNRRRCFELRQTQDAGVKVGRSGQV